MVVKLEPVDWSPNKDFRASVGGPETITAKRSQSSHFVNERI